MRILLKVILDGSFMFALADKPNYALMTDKLSTQCIWEDFKKNITALLSGYPQPSVAWARGDGKQISNDQDAFKMFLEPYWENGRPDEWMANLQVRYLLNFLSRVCGSI